MSGPWRGLYTEGMRSDVSFKKDRRASMQMVSMKEGKCGSRENRVGSFCSCLDEMMISWPRMLVAEGKKCSDSEFITKAVLLGLADGCYGE